MGRVLTEEHKARISAAARVAWQARRSRSWARRSAPAPVRQPDDCTHWWLVPCDKTAALSPEDAARFPDAVGRPSVCKKCGLEKTLAEHHGYTK